MSFYLAPVLLLRIDADPSASIESGYTVNEFGAMSSVIAANYWSTVTASRFSDGRRGRGPWALPRGYERLPRKYVCGVVPSIVRNISMKALTLS